MDEEAFLKERFRSYYAKTMVQHPPAVVKREFGVGVFGKKISQRHLSFASLDLFNAFLRGQTPFFVSYSPGYYRDPAARPMEAKGWEGGDLVFEFDSDDLKTDCKERHDSWVCTQCLASGKGNLKACTSCGSAAKVEEWVCPDCLAAVKKQSLVLLDWLQNDLGFSEGLGINFSGSKGFHLHVRSDAARQLPPPARIEILDFLTGHGLDLEAMGFAERNKQLFGVSFSKAKGWQKKILLQVLNLLEQNDASALAVAGSVSIRTAQKMLERKDFFLESLCAGVFPAVGAKGNAFWLSVLQNAASDLKLNVDRQTSLDKFKIVRVPQTLHGSTGLAASVVSPDGFKSFEALSQSVVFSDEPVPVWVAKTPKFFLKNEWFGPFEEETVSLPEFAAVFLLSRQSAFLSKPLQTGP